ncbi:MAG: hypothetical protein ACXVEF_31220 [Polyangiales bacterium]
MQTAPSADQTTELTDLDLDGALEEDELTIRRDFAPRSPARVAVDVNDADATWKWSSSKKADSAGRRVGLDLPALDGEAALAWNRDDVEKTLEVFALKKSEGEVIALLKPKRRPLPSRPVESTAQLMAIIAPTPKKARWIAPVAICLAAMFIAMFVTRLSRTSQAIIGEARAATAVKPAGLVAMAAPVSTTGTLLTTLEGKGQRVFVDGKVAFEGGQSHTVECGKHIVRVGNGKSHEVDVPCGAELALAP